MRDHRTGARRQKQCGNWRGPPPSPPLNRKLPALLPCSRTPSALAQRVRQDRTGARTQKRCANWARVRRTARPRAERNLMRVRWPPHPSGGNETQTQREPPPHTSKRAACRFRPHRPRSTDYLVTKRAEWVVFLSASAIIRTPAVHPRNLCEALADETRISQAHNASALVAARSAWVPGARAGKDGWETGTFSSGPALAFRPFRSYLSTPVTTLTSRPQRTFD
ncbi:Uncharacterised protein [Nocardia brasiliensis]|nr:Uncharacterised protein [Nocardia brasiliensis]